MGAAGYGTAGGAVAPGDAQYLTLALSDDLSAERRAVFSTGLTVVDGGANGNATITVDLSTGKAGGLTVTGGTAASENLTLRSTAHATKGKLLFGTSAYDEVNNRLGLGTATPTARLHVAQSVAAAATPTALALLVGAAHTALPASTEATDVTWQLNRTVEFATGALTLQRAAVIGGPTYAFVGPSTLTDAITLDISAPLAGANATLTRRAALRLIDADNQPGGANATCTDLLVLEHTTTAGTPAPGFGANILFRGQDDLKSAGGENMGRIGVCWSDSTEGSEDSRIEFWTRTGGSALAQVLGIQAGTVGTVSIFPYPVSTSSTISIGAINSLPTAGVGGGFTGMQAYQLGTDAVDFYVTGGLSLRILPAQILIDTEGTATSLDLQVRDAGGLYRIAAGRLGFATGASGASTLRMELNANSLIYTPGAASTGSPSHVVVTGAAHTTLTASTEAIDVNWNLARTVQFATGALATQRAVVYQAPTYGFVGASTLSDTATVAISGAPIAGANATITRRHALWLTDSDATTNAVSDVLRIDHATSDVTPTTNFGAAALFRLHNNDGATNTMVDAGRVRFYWTTATEGAEASAFGIGLRVVGAALPAVGSDTYLFSSTGAVTLPASSTIYTVGASSGVQFTTTQINIVTGAAANVRVGTNVVAIPTALNAGGSGAVTAGERIRLAANVGAVSATSATLNNFHIPADTNVITGSADITTATGFNVAAIGQNTYSAASALTITTAASLYIAGAPKGGGAGPAKITNSYALNVGGDTTVWNIAGSLYASVNVPAHTLTLSQTTQVTSKGPAGISIGQLTVAQSGGAVTVDNAASLYIADAPLAGASVTITNKYGLWIDAGLSRFDGDGSVVFELPADATDPTAGGGAAAGRIPVKIGGATKYLAYY